MVYPAILEQGAAHLKNMTANDLHEWFLGEVYGWQTSVCFGRIRQKPRRRSHNLKVSEFMDYVGEITARMAEIGIVIPEPNEDIA